MTDGLRERLAEGQRKPEPGATYTVEGARVLELEAELATLKAERDALKAQLEDALNEIAANHGHIRVKDAAP